MKVVRIEPPALPLFIAFQGGAALGAFSLGAIEAISEHNPNRKVIGVTGTSSGALTACFFAEGYIKGGFREAVRRSEECWEGMSKYQDDTCSNFWFRYKDAEGLAAMYGSLPLLRSWMQAFNEVASHTSQPALSASPILAFLAKMKQDGRGLDFEAIQKTKEDDFLVVANATRVLENANPWLAKASDERVFKNAAITPAVIAASGALIELVPAVVVNREPLRDGAYFSNPHLPTVAKHCMEKGADLLVIRTRPANSFAPLNGKVPQTDDERRAFFNNMLDRQLDEVRRDYPGLNISVIEPAQLEGQHPRRLLKPELSFHPDDLKNRRIAGYNAAVDVIAHNPKLFPMHRNMSMPVAAAAMPQSAVAAAS